MCTDGSLFMVGFLSGEKYEFNVDRLIWIACADMILIFGILNF